MFTGLVRNCNEHALGNYPVTREADAMKVTRNTPAQLIVEDRPIFVTLLMAGFLIGTLSSAVFSLFAGAFFPALFFAIFAGGLALAMRLAVRRVQVIFDRTASTITERSRGFEGYREVVHPLGDLSHAIKEGYDSARCVLVFHKGMSQGHHPITQYSSGGRGPKRVTDAINDWLKTPAPVDSEPSSA